MGWVGSVLGPYQTLFFVNERRKTQKTDPYIQNGNSKV